MKKIDDIKFMKENYMNHVVLEPCKIVPN